MKETDLPHSFNSRQESLAGEERNRLVGLFQLQPRESMPAKKETDLSGSIDSIRGL
ncbi:MAG: hypothetical protein K6G65_01570 [Lachnospiraceae bacterium]|nr:hypothetical protein [Lachnospiraceae bacterium]